MPLTLELLTPPVIEPVTVQEASRHCRVDEDIPDYFLIEGFITASRQSIEEYLRRQLLTATWKYSLDRFPNLIKLPRPPAQSVTMIEYIDENEQLQTLDPSQYQVDVASEPARVMVAKGQSWPSTSFEVFNKVQITYVAGWTNPTLIPPPIRLGVSMLVGDLYEHREARLDMGSGLTAIEQNETYDRLLWFYRILSDL